MEHCQLERSRLYAEPGSQVPELQQQDVSLWQRGSAAFLLVPSDNYPDCRLFRHSLEYWHPAQVPDRHLDFLLFDPCLIRTTGQAFQSCAFLLWHEAREAVS